MAYQKENFKKWAIENKTYRKKYMQRWRKKNKEKIKEYEKTYNANRKKRSSEEIVPADKQKTTIKKQIITNK